MRCQTKEGSRTACRRALGGKPSQSFLDLFSGIGNLLTLTVCQKSIQTLFLYFSSLQTFLEHFPKFSYWNFPERQFECITRRRVRFPGARGTQEIQRGVLTHVDKCRVFSHFKSVLVFGHVYQLIGSSLLVLCLCAWQVLLGLQRTQLHHCWLFQSSCNGAFVIADLWNWETCI